MQSQLGLGMQPYVTMRGCHIDLIGVKARTCAGNTGARVTIETVGNVNCV